MCSPLTRRLCLVLLALVVFAAERNADANERPFLSEILPIAPDDPDDVELDDDWFDNKVVLVGTPDDDKITIVVDDENIRFWLGDEHIGRIRERNLPDDPVDNDTTIMGQDVRSALQIIVSGGGGNDEIVLITDNSDGPPLFLFDRVLFLLYGDDGDDYLRSEGVDQVTMVGGTGTDFLVGGGFESKFLGGDVRVGDVSYFEAIPVPDSSTDVILPKHYEATAYRNYYLNFAPVAYLPPTIQNVKRTPPKLPGVPTIASREKADAILFEPEPVVYDKILLDRDLVLNDIGCLVLDINLHENGSMLPPTPAE